MKTWDWHIKLVRRSFMPIKLLFDHDGYVRSNDRDTYKWLIERNVPGVKYSILWNECMDTDIQSVWRPVSLSFNVIMKIK